MEERQRNKQLKPNTQVLLTTLSLFRRALWRRFLFRTTGWLGSRVVSPPSFLVARTAPHKLTPSSRPFPPFPLPQFLTLPLIPTTPQPPPPHTPPFAMRCPCFSLSCIISSGGSSACRSSTTVIAFYFIAIFMSAKTATGSSFCALDGERRRGRCHRVRGLSLPPR